MSMRKQSPSFAILVFLVAAFAAGPAIAGDVIELTDQQLDEVTAGVGAGVNVGMNASGPIVRTNAYTRAYSNQKQTGIGPMGVAIGLGIGSAVAVGPNSSTSGSVNGAGQGNRVAVHRYVNTSGGRLGSWTSGVVVVVAVQNPRLGAR